jgi:hypothetical protein
MQHLYPENKNVPGEDAKPPYHEGANLFRTLPIFCGNKFKVSFAVLREFI